MKIIEIEINCLRGIKNIKLNLNGENALIYGDNGTGKSGIVDAIDFLFKGNISRLQGEGAGALDLQKHGKHISSTGIESWVKAKIKLPGINEVINIERRLNNSKILICPEKYKEKFDKVIKMAELQSHFLSRREILVFINSTGQDRAKGIEKLLNLQNIEDNRKLLNNLCNDYDKKLKAQKQTVDTNNATISKLLNVSEINWLSAINGMRNNLGVIDIDNVFSDLLVGINYTKNDLQKNEITRLLDLVETVISSIYKGTDSLVTLMNNIQSICSKLEAVAEIKNEICALELYEKGNSLAKNDKCPLCEQPISTEILKTKLSQKIENLNSVKQQSIAYNKALLQSKAFLQSSIKTISDNLTYLKKYDTNNEFEKLLICLQNFNKLQESIEILVSNDICKAINELPLQEKLEGIKSEMMNISANLALDNYAKSYSDLSALKAHIQIYKSSLESFDRVKSYYLKIKWLLDNFNKIQTEKLNEMYEDVQERFDELYRIMHSSDEGGFKSTFDRKAKSLDLSVGFFDGNMYPPNAVHSEGHQDSMGICLFLALSEKITNSIFNLIVLDDVVMSIDIDHRKNFCKILAEQFPEKQFIITTHDLIWRKELEYHKIVEKKNIFHFRAWDYINGPYFSQGDDIWDTVKNELTAGKKNEAIGLLRYYMEETFSDICKKYKLKVPYSHDARWTLSETLQPAYIFYKEAFEATLKNARHYKKDDTKYLHNYTEFRKSYTELKTEEWMLNPSVHFTIWAENLSQNELRDLIQAVKNFCDRFYCQACGSIIEINANINYQSKSMSCSCGEYSASCLTN